MSANPGHDSLIRLTAGHPLAVKRLREMQAVIDAVLTVDGERASMAWPRVHGRITQALLDGGWIK